MAHELRFRPAALADLEDIFARVLQVSGKPYGRAALHRANPRTLPPHYRAAVGRPPRDDLAPGLRTAPFERHAVIVYRVSAGGIVEIVNIFHGGRDYEALYRRAPQDDDA